MKHESGAAGHGAKRLECAELAPCGGAPNPNGVAAGGRHRRLVFWPPGRNPVGVDAPCGVITQGWRCANPGLCSTTPLGLERDALRGCLRRQRRHSYQPRALPWALGFGLFARQRRAGISAQGSALGKPSRNPNPPCKGGGRAQESSKAGFPRVLPWADMLRAFSACSSVKSVGSADTRGFPSHRPGPRPIFLNPFPVRF
jgi:hypothetical protein